jgi:hypothetical protein
LYLENVDESAFVVVVGNKEDLENRYGYLWDVGLMGVMRFINYV